MASYREKHDLFRQQAEELVSKMTLEEAASQLRYDAPAIERLDIPAYNWWNETLHGVARAGTATMFPQAIALAAMFDTEAMNTFGRICAAEGRAKYNAQSALDDRDIYKGLTFWTPNINIFRDPRWGRGHETYGEDPFLTARLGVVFIEALQGHGEYMKAAACAKHFAVHSGPEAERHFFDAQVSEHDLYDTYLPAFEAAVTEAGVESVMGAYNRVNGEAACAHSVLMGQILRGKWGFKGHFVSDCWAIRDFHTEHKITKTAPESAALALKAGCDLNCGNTYLHLLEAYNEKLITEEDIRAAAVNLFTTRFKLGLFAADNPFNRISYLECDTEENNLASFNMSLKSAVMLKNNGLLPLDRHKIKTIGVIGPNANSIPALTGNYFGTASAYITNLAGIKEYCENTVRILYSEGCHLINDRSSSLSLSGDRLAEAKTVAQNSDAVILCLGLDASVEGEEGDTGNAFAAGDKVSLNLPEPQAQLLDTVLDTGKPVVLVLNSGSALNLSAADERCAAVLQAWYSGPFGGRALAQIIFGEHSPCGKLPVTFYKSDGDLPDFRDYSMKNRTYRYFNGEPLYPFGFGLSYSEFTYDDLRLERDAIKEGQDLRISVTVTNTGDFDAYEITQVYVKLLCDGVYLPNFSLCGFSNVMFSKGQQKTLDFTIKASAFTYVDENGKRVLKKGEAYVYAGGSAPDSRSVQLTKKAPLCARVKIS